MSKFVDDPVIGCSSVTAPVMANGRSQERLSGRSPNPLPKKMPGWSVSGLPAPILVAPEPPMPQPKPAEIITSCSSFLYSRPSARAWSCRIPTLGRSPVAMHPSAFDLEGERRGQEARE